MQADPQSNKAIFQRASNFNRLAGFMGRDRAYLEDMAHATAQEEAAIVGTAFATIYTRYILAKQNLLEHLNLNLVDDDHIKIDHNYSALDVTNEQQIIKNTAIGIHQNILVISGGILKGNGPEAIHTKCTNPNQKVHHILTAAIDLSYKSAMAYLTLESNKNNVRR